MEDQNALVVDDDVDISNLLAMVLGLVGYETEVSHSAKDALSRLVTSSPDLVLLDMQFGAGLSGEDILYQIRANPRLKNTRVVVVTGHPERAVKVAELADYVLNKPIDVDQLKSVIMGLKNKEQTAARDYFRDPVTGVYNRDFFRTRLEHAIERAKRRKDFVFAVTVIVMELYEMDDETQAEPEVVNAILRDATQSLMQNLRPTDTVARLSFAKFATLHEELRAIEDVDIIIRRIQTILTPSFNINDRQYRLTFRIGKVTSKDFSKKVTDLLTLAEYSIVAKG